jgi:hypothetical protein
MTIRIPTHRETVCGSKDGNAETKAPTPAENAYSGRQDVIGEERGRGKQAGRCAKPTIFLISDARRVARTFAAVGGHPAGESCFSTLIRLKVPAPSTTALVVESALVMGVDTGVPEE